MCNCISHNHPDWGGTEPEVILPWRKYFPWSGRETVCVDPCIAEQIEKMWADGIETGGCCCGHNGQGFPAGPSVILMKGSDVVEAQQVLVDDPRDWIIWVWA